MSAPTCSARVRERLGRLGIRGEVLQAFLAWAQQAGYLDPMDRHSDRDLAGRVAEFATAADRASVASVILSRGLPPRPTPAARPTEQSGQGGREDDVALRALVARLAAEVLADHAPQLCEFPPPVPTPAIVRRETHR
jgi:hypothetical protein